MRAGSLLLCGCMFFYSGCDLFSTRDPELPDQSTSGFKPPVTPEIVLENFKSAIQEHNVDNYIRCFADSAASQNRFTFSPSAGYKTQLTAWSLEDERRYFQNMGEPLSSDPFLDLSDLKELNRTSTSTEYTGEYLLYYPHQSADISREVRGYMHLLLAVDYQQQWSILTWDDSETVTDSTWSYLKYSFYL